MDLMSLLCGRAVDAMIGIKVGEWICRYHEWTIVDSVVEVYSCDGKGCI